MPAKQKPVVPRPKSSKTTQRRPSTPTERGDTDLEGGAASYASDTRARQPVQGQQRQVMLSSEQPDTPRTRGVDDHRDEIAAETEKAIRKASLRARRLGLH